MASIERTAYPRFSRTISEKELAHDYTLTPRERRWIEQMAKSPAHRLGLAVQLKAFQRLFYFPALSAIPPEIVEHVRASLKFGERVRLNYANNRTLYRHTNAIRAFLGITPFYGSNAKEIAVAIAEGVAEVLDQRIDVINAMVEELIDRDIELPAFSTLDNIAEQAHAAVQERLFNQTVGRLTPPQISRLDGLLATDFGKRQSDFNSLKQIPKKPSRKHLEVLLEHLAWLESFGDLDAIFADVRETKVRFFASQTQNYDVAELKECAPAKRYTLVLALIYRMRIRARDHLAEMFIRRMATIHKRAKDELVVKQANQRGQMEQLVATLDGVLEILAQEPDDLEAGQLIREYVAPHGSIDELRQACANVQAVSGDNYLPMLWRHFRSHRSLMFGLVDLLRLEPTTQDLSLMKALAVVVEYEAYHREWIDEHIDLSFASDRWKKLIRRCPDKSAHVLS